jgi:hypothetical protein
MKQTRQLPYKRLLYFLSNKPLPMNKEENIEQKKEEEKPLTPPRKLSYVNRKSFSTLIYYV